MIPLAATLLVVAAVAWVISPLLRRGKAPWQAEAQASELRDLLEQRDTLLGAIQQLDFDRDLGNLGEEDHRRLRSRYVRRTTALLRRLENRKEELEAEVEQEVAALLRQQEEPPSSGDGARDPR